MLVAAALCGSGCPAPSTPPAPRIDRFTAELAGYDSERTLVQLTWVTRDSAAVAVEGFLASAEPAGKAVVEVRGVRGALVLFQLTASNASGSADARAEVRLQGTLRGTVVDSFGNGYAGASVTVGARTTACADDGTFELRGVQDPVYSAKVAFPLVSTAYIFAAAVIDTPLLVIPGVSPEVSPRTALLLADVDGGTDAGDESVALTTVYFLARESAVSTSRQARDFALVQPIEWASNQPSETLLIVAIRETVEDSRRVIHSAGRTADFLVDAGSDTTVTLTLAPTNALSVVAEVDKPVWADKVFIQPRLSFPGHRPLVDLPLFFDGGVGSVQIAAVSGGSLSATVGTTGFSDASRCRGCSGSARATRSNVSDGVVAPFDLPALPLPRYEIDAAIRRDGGISWDTPPGASLCVLTLFNAVVGGPSFRVVTTASQLSLSELEGLPLGGIHVEVECETGAAIAAESSVDGTLLDSAVRNRDRRLGRITGAPFTLTE